MRRFIRTSRWDDVYKTMDIEELPWYNPKLDRDIEKALGEFKITKGTALDIGSGPGTQAIELAKRGFKVTALDISETATEKAEALATEVGVKIEFIVGDILKIKLEETFNLVVDRGCFHIILPAKRPDYVKIVSGLLKARGRLFLKAFSHKEPPGPGPYRFTPEEIRGYFGGRFKERSIVESSFKGALSRAPKALFCVFQKQG